MASSSLFLLILSALLLMVPSATTASNNVLLTGQTLLNEQMLSYEGSIFIMQDDCNLVLYSKGRGFQSNTHGNGLNCTLSFSDNGRLVIRRAGGSTVWMTSNAHSPKGRYAAVLRPDGELAIYGPSVWSTGVAPTLQQPHGGGPLRAFPRVDNVLFSGQILKGGERLASRVYSFVMRGDCNLALNMAGLGTLWQSHTAGNGRSCFLQLDNKGLISVKEGGSNRVVWSSTPSSTPDREYVLVLQDDGEAVIYGPQVWSTYDRLEIAEATEE